MQLCETRATRGTAGRTRAVDAFRDGLGGTIRHHTGQNAFQPLFLFGTSHRFGIRQSFLFQTQLAQPGRLAHSERVLGGYDVSSRLIGHGSLFPGRKSNRCGVRPLRRRHETSFHRAELTSHGNYAFIEGYNSGKFCIFDFIYPIDGRYFHIYNRLNIFSSREKHYRPYTKGWIRACSSGPGNGVATNESMSHGLLSAANGSTLSTSSRGT